MNESKTVSINEKLIEVIGIFKSIRELCSIPQPPLQPINDLPLIFADIKVLCQLPQVLEPIDDSLTDKLTNNWQTIEPVKQCNDNTSNKTRGKTYKSDYYCDNMDKTNTDCVDVFQSKLFCSIVKQKRTIDETVNHTENNKKLICKENKPKTRKKVTKQKNPVINMTKTFSIFECDIKAKLQSYCDRRSMENSKAKRTRKTKSNSNGKQDVSDVSQKSSDISVQSSSLISNSYSMPATPNSSVSSEPLSHSQSLLSSITTKSLMSKCGFSLQSKIESYRDYFNRNKKCAQNAKRFLKQKSIDYNQKVLEWRLNRLSSGNVTPVHGIEFMSTPPSTPITVNPLIDDDFSELLDNIAQQNLSDNNSLDYTTLLNELFADADADTDASTFDHNPVNNQYLDFDQFFT